MTMISDILANRGLVQIFQDILVDGGIFMWLIIFTSMALIAIMVFKSLTLTKGNVIPTRLMHQVEQFSANPNESNASELQTELDSNDSILSTLCKKALAKQDEDREDIEKAVEIKARQSVVRISSGMSMIDVIITIAPLLGLLGTASGLVSVFASLDGEVTDHTALAKGISEALYTTIAGLAVAVPGVIAQSHFSRRIETMAAELELIMSSFVASISK